MLAACPQVFPNSSFATINSQLNAFFIIVSITSNMTIFFNCFSKAKVIGGDYCSRRTNSRNKYLFESVVTQLVAVRN